MRLPDSRHLLAGGARHHLFRSRAQSLRTQFTESSGGDGVRPSEEACRVASDRVLTEAPGGSRRAAGSQRVSDRPTSRVARHPRGAPDPKNNYTLNCFK